MKNCLYLLIVTLLLISCKQDQEQQLQESEKSDATVAPVSVYEKSEVKLKAFDVLEALKYHDLEALMIGETIPDLNLIQKEGQSLRKDVYRTGDISFDVIYLNKNGKDIIRFFPDITKNFMITFLEPEAVPEDMIKPGSVYADLNETYPEAQAVGSVLNSDVFVRLPDATFKMAAKNSNPIPIDIPAGTPIVEITVQGK